MLARSRRERLPWIGLAIALFASPAAAEEVALELLTVTLPGSAVERTVEERTQGTWGVARVTWVSAKGSDGIVRRVALVEPKRPARPAKLRSFLVEWRQNHGCVANPTRAFAALHSGASPVPQITFEGSCEGGDSYRARVLVIGGLAYELHVDATFGRASGERLDAAFRELLAAVTLRAPPTPPAARRRR